MAPVAEMHCTVDEANCPSAEPENIMTDAEGSNIGRKFTAGATSEHAPKIAVTAVEAESKIDSDIEKILAHRYDRRCDTRFEMKVRWKGGTESWEHEIDLQRCQKVTLFAYWDSLEGGREGAMADPGLWHLFDIVSHKRKSNGGIRFQVAWVGSAERTWEPEETVRDADNELLEKYWDSKDRSRKAAKKSVKSKDHFKDTDRATDGSRRMERLGRRRSRYCNPERPKNWRHRHGNA
ncbi:hypothetical protein LY76DRAFT_688518 [Colletotrichum caudatum]|nr:hypothetical protein LY76DRAFT_688518 [Colletotrichum caudatum]